MRTTSTMRILIAAMVVVFLWPATALAHYRPAVGRWLERDPLIYGVPSIDRDVFPTDGYVDGKCLFEYVRSTPLVYLDEEGLQAAGLHHAYPLHLGGECVNQPLWDFKGAENVWRHQAFHDYMREHGFPYGDAGRANWLKLTERQQQAHIMRALRKAGIPNEMIRATIDDIMKGAKPGTKITRTCARGSIIRLPLVAASATVVLGMTSTCYAPCIDWSWRGYGDDNTTCECECRDVVELIIATDWYNIVDISDPEALGPVRGTWLNFGQLTAQDCASLEGILSRRVVDRELGYVTYEEVRSECRWGGSQYGVPFDPIRQGDY